MLFRRLSRAFLLLFAVGFASPAPERDSRPRDGGASLVGQAARLGPALFAAPAEAGLLGRIGPTDTAADGAVFSRQDSLGRGAFGGGRTTRVTVEVQGLAGLGYLSGWIDWRGSGYEAVALDLRDGGTGDLDPRPGFIAFDVRAPLNVAAAARSLRLRWTAAPGLPAAFVVLDGEREDHVVSVYSGVGAPLACPAGYGLREALRNGALQMNAANSSWPEWTVSSLFTASEAGAPSSGLHMSDDNTSGSATQTGLLGLSSGPSALGGGALFLDMQWNQGNPASSSHTTPSRLTALINGVEHLVMETGPGSTNTGQIRHPVSDPGAVDQLNALTWTRLRVDLPPVSLPASSTLSFLFTPPGQMPSGAWTPNDDFRIRDLSLQTCAPLGKIRLQMQASSMTPLIEAPMEFQIHAQSEGVNAVRDLVVLARPPAGYRFISAQANQGSYDAASGLWTVGDIPTGQSRLLRLTVTPLASGVRTMIAEATAYSHLDPDSTPGNGVTTEHDYVALTPVPYRGALPGFTPPTCRTGEPARQILLNGDFQGFATGSGWPNWTRTSTAWYRFDANTQGAHIEQDSTTASLSQTGLANMNRGPGVSGGALLHLELWWRNGGGSTTISSTSALTVSLGGVAYARVTTPNDMATFAAAAAQNGATVLPAQLTEFAASSLQVHLPADVAASGELRFNYVASGSAGDDFRIRSAALYVCDGEVALTPNHESTVPPGQILAYPHNLRLSPAMQGAAVSFETVSSQGLGWILRKDDGDGIFNAALDPVWVPGAPLNAGTHAFWAVAQVPAEAPAGWRDLTILRARAVLGWLSDSSEAWSLTRVGGAEEGAVHAVKTAAPDFDCDGQPDAGAPFVAELSVASGRCAVYRIQFENRGAEPISRVRIHDHTPDWTTYLGGTAAVDAPPPGLAATAAEAPAAGQEGPILFSFEGALEPGAGGAVRFGVRLLGVSGAGSNPGGPAN